MHCALLVMRNVLATKDAEYMDRLDVCGERGKDREGKRGQRRKRVV